MLNLLFVLYIHQLGDVSCFLFDVSTCVDEMHYVCITPVVGSCYWEAFLEIR